MISQVRHELGERRVRASGRKEMEGVDTATGFQVGLPGALIIKRGAGFGRENSTLWG